MGALAPVYLHVAGRSHANPLMAGGGKATACPSHRVLRMPTQQSMRTHMSNQHIDPSDNSGATRNLNNHVAKQVVKQALLLYPKTSPNDN